MKKGLLGFWKYFKDSWEGKDGKFSYRRFSQYIFLICMIRMGFKPPVNQYELTVFIIFASLYALIATVITAQQLIELSKAKITFKVNEDTPNITEQITDETEQKSE